MSKISSIDDIRVGHVLKAALACVSAGFVWLCMWLGEISLGLIVAATFHLSFQEIGIPQLDHMANNFLIFGTTLVLSWPMAALVWVQFYPEKKSG